MKIGIVTNLYPPYVRGGAEHVVVRTVEELIEKNHDIIVISTGPKAEYKKMQVDDRQSEKIYRFYPRNLYFLMDDHKHAWPVRFLWHMHDAFTMSSVFRVSKILNEETPDVVITHNLKGIGLGIPRCIQKKKIPHIHVVHDLQLIYPSGLLFAGKENKPTIFKPLYKMYQAVCRFKFGRPDVVIFPSNFLKEEYLKHGFFKKSKVVVLPNPAPDFEPEEKDYSNESDTLRLLFVGQLETHKGIQFLLETFSKFNQKSQLIIAGEGKYTDLVLERASKDRRITHLGYIAIEQLINCFGVADALVVPSLCYENSPTVIYESFQAGVPVIASDIGGVGELVNHGKNGFLFKPGDQADFLRVLRKMVEEKHRFDLGEIKNTVKPYAARIYAEKIMTLIKEISE